LVEHGNVVLGLGINLVLELGGISVNFLLERGLLLSLNIAKVSGHAVENTLEIVSGFLDLTHSQVVILLVLLSCEFLPGGTFVLEPLFDDCSVKAVLNCFVCDHSLSFLHSNLKLCWFFNVFVLIIVWILLV